MLVSNAGHPTLYLGKAWVEKNGQSLSSCPEREDWPTYQYISIEEHERRVKAILDQTQGIAS